MGALKSKQALLLGRWAALLDLVSAYWDLVTALSLQQWVSHTQAVHLPRHVKTSHAAKVVKLENRVRDWSEV